MTAAAPMFRSGSDYVPAGNTEVSEEIAENAIEDQGIKPIPVMVVGSERQRIARYRSTITVATINPTDVLPIQQILPQATKRHRALISSRDVATITTGLGSNTVPQPAVPASTTAQSNFFNFPVNVNVVGGTVSAIAVNGNPTGLTSGTVTVPAGGSITLTYTVAPTWTWTQAVGTTTQEVREYVLVGSREQVQNGQGYRVYNGETRIIESSSSMFIGPGTTPPTHTISVSVIDERYE